MRSKFATIRAGRWYDGEVAVEGEISAGIVSLADDHEPA